jgi:hypothetical protein
MAKGLSQPRRWTISANRDEGRAQFVRDLSRLFRAGCRVDRVRLPEAELRVLAKFVCYFLTSSKVIFAESLGLTRDKLTRGFRTNWIAMEDKKGSAGRSNLT